MSSLHFSLAGKAAIVTGAGGGIGRALAHRLAQLGAAVVVVDRDVASGRAYAEYGHANVAEEIREGGGRAIAFEADLSRRVNAVQAIEHCRTEFGRLDILVNNAGGAFTPFERSSGATIPDEDIDALIGANLMSTIYCCQAAAPWLSRPGGAIINISSIGASHVVKGGTYAIYGAAKAAVEQYTRSLAVELGPEGIRVNCIAPGPIETPRVLSTAVARGIASQADGQAIPLRRLGRTADIAGAMEFLVSDLAAFVTGECLTVAGGATLVAGG